MSNVLQKLCIIAIPLTRPYPSRKPITKSSRLIYHQFQITVPRLNKPPLTTRLANADHQESETASNDTKKKGWLPEEDITTWLTNKAADTWAGFGKEKSGWKLKVYQAGELMMDRMEFEELALKSIDLSKSPSVDQLKSNPSSENKNVSSTISLVFPPSLLSSSEVLSELRRFAEQRTPKHRRGFYLWMLIAPLTAPLKLIPIIPNLPFFFCVWRSWSHYRAYRSSQYLQSLLDHNLIVPESSESLDEVYKLYPPTTESSPSDPGFIPKTNPEKKPQHILLLRPEAVPSILSLFEFESTTSSSSADLHRAIEQARLRVSSGHMDL